MTPERRREIWQIILTRIPVFSEQARTHSEMRDREAEDRTREEHIGSLMAEYVIDEVIRGRAAGVIPTRLQRIGPERAGKLLGVIESRFHTIKVRGLDDALIQRQLEMAKDYGEDGAIQLHLKGLALQCNYWENTLQGNPSEPLQKFGQSRLEAISGQIAELTRPQLPHNHS